MTDEELLQQCQIYGKKARIYMRQFAYLLPEVFRRHLHRKCGCASIEEYAAKTAGMSHEVCRRVISIELKLRKHPQLWEQVKVIGWTKLGLIAGIVEYKDKEFWLKSLVLSQSSLQKLVTRVRAEREQEILEKYGAKISSECASISLNKENVNFVLDGKAQTANAGTSKREASGGQKSKDMESKQKTEQIYSNIYSKMTFHIDDQTDFEFRRLKNALEKQKKEPVTMGEVLKYLLKKHKEIEEAKPVPTEQAAVHPLQLKSNRIPKKQRQEALKNRRPLRTLLQTIRRIPPPRLLFTSKKSQQNHTTLP